MLFFIQVFFWLGLLDLFVQTINILNGQGDPRYTTGILFIDYVFKIGMLIWAWSLI